MSIFGSIAKAVAGPLIGGLFGKKKAKAQGVDYKKLRDDALAAGFNPLTALMAGGGAGYQREFNPAMSSGSFIAEAVQRGVDTYFDMTDAEAAQADADAEAIREHERRKDLIKFEHDLNRTRGTFGYDLAAQAPFTPSRRVAPPAIAGGSGIASPDYEPKRPPLNPAFRDPLYIRVRDMTGAPIALDAGIARRLDIKPGDTLMAGDIAEIEGDLLSEPKAAANTVAGDNAAYALPDRHRSRRQQVTSKPKMTKPSALIYQERPKPGWMDEFFGGSFSQ